MTSPNGNYFNIGRSLALILALLVALILGGNGLVIYQFKRAQLQTDRLTGVSQQLIAVLRLQESLLSFHQRLNELAQSKDANRLATEAEPAPARRAQLAGAGQLKSGPTTDSNSGISQEGTVAAPRPARCAVIAVPEGELSAFPVTSYAITDARASVRTSSDSR